MVQTLTALYDTRGAAEATRDDLVNLGISSSEIAIRGADDTTDTVREEGGFWSGLADFFMPREDEYTYAEGVRRGGYLLSVHVPDNLASQAEDILEKSEPVDLDERSEEWRKTGWSDDAAYTSGAGVTGGTAAASAYGLSDSRPAAFSAADSTTADLSSRSATLASGDASILPGDQTALDTQATNLTSDIPATATTGTDAGYAARSSAYETGERTLSEGETIPVYEEQIKIGKRQVDSGSVRVRSYVTERPVNEEVQLRTERVTIDRRPVDREVNASDADFRERVIEAVEHGEEAVVSKTVRVKEEIGIHKDVDTRTETVSDTVRSTEVEIDDGRTDKTATGYRTDTDKLTNPRV